MNHSKSALLFGGLLFVAFTFLISTGSAPAAGLPLDELYEKSGMKEELLYIAPAMVEEFDSGFKELESSEKQVPENIIKTSRDLLANAYSAESLKKTVFDEFGSNMTESEINAVIDWLDAPLGKKATQLEMEAAKPEAEPQIQEFIAQTDKNPPPQERMNLIVQYERATHLAEATTSMILGMQLATGIALQSIFTPPEEQKSPSELSEAVEQNRTMLEGKVRPELIGRLIYTYRTLSDDELKKLIEFESSDLGSKYTRTSFTGVQKAIVEATANFSKNLFQVIKEFKQKPAA